MTVAVQYALTDLLERAGAKHITNRRADCPRCGAKRTVSHTDEVFYCHHSGCDFRGNAFTLAKELGIARWIPREEYQRLHREREQARQAAELLAKRVEARQLELNHAHRECLDVIRLAHEAGPTESVWVGLAMAYKTLPEVRAELLALEDAGAAEALEILNDGPERERLLFQAMCLDDGPPSVDGPSAEQAGTSVKSS